MSTYAARATRLRTPFSPHALSHAFLSRPPSRLPRAHAQLCQLHDTAPLLTAGTSPSEWAIASVAVVVDDHTAGGHHVHHVTPFFCADEAPSEPILQRSLASRSPFRCDTMVRS